MLILALLLVAACAASTVLFLAEIAPRRAGAVRRRLAQFQLEAGITPEVLRRRRREIQARKFAGVLEGLGQRVESGQRNLALLRLQLVQAGFPDARAVPLFLGARLALPIGLSLGMFLLLPAAGFPIPSGLLAGSWLGVLGYVGPALFVSSRRRARTREMQKALPDALDLLVVCVEAGLALNQALTRVADEVERLSPVLSQQLSLVNLEIRAGTAREDALKNLGERTGLDDIKSLAGMLIQTDRFGTSIGQALRVQADNLRTKRRQRAEEAAAKTTIKLVFPLVLLIFPAMFVVILGPALIRVINTLSSFRV